MIKNCLSKRNYSTKEMTIFYEGETIYNLDSACSFNYHDNLHNLMNQMIGGNTALQVKFTLRHTELPNNFPTAQFLYNMKILNTRLNYNITSREDNFRKQLS